MFQGKSILVDPISSLLFVSLPVVGRGPDRGVAEVPFEILLVNRSWQQEWNNHTKKTQDVVELVTLAAKAD